MIASFAMRHVSALVLSLSLAASALGGPGLIRGVVLELEGAPGQPHGIPGVEVSNGREVVVTDSAGHYAVPPGPEPIFVIQPSGWTFPSAPKNLPPFYHAEGGDFILSHTPEDPAFKFLVFTDTQPANAKEGLYFQKTLVDPRKGKSGCAFGITLGDIVYDRPDLFPAMQDAVGQIGIPWHAIPGNHDTNVLAGSEKEAVSAYENAYGPSTYAFRYAHVTFLALDDVRPRGGPRYVGGFTPDQFTFMQAVLKRTSPDDLVVLLIHIPLFPDPLGADSFRAADRARLFALLKDRTHLLVLSSHTHVQRHVLHDEADGWAGTSPLHEYNVAAACGGFWGGVPNADGIPPATMWDGTPPGCAVVSVTGTAYALDYEPSEFPADHQLGLYVPKVVAPHLGYVGAYANVYNAYKAWKIEARVDAHAWGPMNSIVGWDPTYTAAFMAQDSGPNPAVGNRLPDPVLCYHLYRAYLPPDLDVGQHHFEVRATDPQGKVFTQMTDFQVAARDTAPREKVTGIGGLFFRAPDPAATADWYEKNLGIDPVPTTEGGKSWQQEAGATAFAPFPTDTGYFGKDHQRQFMLNFRVANLDKLAAQLQAAGIPVKTDPTTYPNGRFARIHDLNGNPVELWEPAAK